MMNKLMLLIGAYFLYQGSVIGQHFTLFEAQSYALENVKEIKNALIDIEIAKKKVNETRAMGLPQVNLEGSFNNFFNLPVQVVDGAFIGDPGTLVSFRAGTDFNASGGVQVSQLIFDGSYIVGLQVSKYYQQFVATNTDLTKQDVLINVTRSYELALVSRENMRFMDSLVASTSSLALEQKTYVELGLLPEEELDQMRYALSTAKTNQLTARLQYENALAFLKLNMGYPQESEINLLDALDGILNEAMILNDGSFQSNIQLDLLAKRMELSKYELKNTKYANLPSLGGYFQHRMDAYRNEFNFFNGNEEWFNQTFWGLRLSVPITSSGQRLSRIRQAELELKQRENDVEHYKRALSMQEVTYRNEFESAIQRMSLQRENVELARRIYKNSVARAKIGKENSLMVTQKYSQLIAAQAQLTGAMVDVFDSKLKIDQLYNTVNTKR